jgi:DegV family protein with EDD domain
MTDLSPSFAAGYACLSAWSDLLDQINVFPVADGDTGTNLRISLAPLRDSGRESKTRIDLLARLATGNSGNIAAAFFREFCQANSYSELAEKAAAGNEKARQAIARPREGTMLTVFDSLAQVLPSRVELDSIYSPLRLKLQEAVQDTTLLLPELDEAGVVDSGALAMYIFFEGFFRHLTGQKGKPESILDLFAGNLSINSSYHPQTADCYCVDLIIEPDKDHASLKSSIAELGESVVVVEDEARLKVHMHTLDPTQLRGQLGMFGDILHWSAEEVDQGRQLHFATSGEATALHIVTDAAGSITREMAQKNGITLLDSYIIVGDTSWPESLHEPAQLYALMRRGTKITTAQAATFERHQHYESICQQFGRSLYLAVGSAFTGNFETVMAWKKDNDPDNLLTVIDTGAASGRLGLITLLTARNAKNTTNPEEVIDFAKKAMADCIELVFIDELKYLVAGGRVSRAGGFFGDLLSMKPVISPTAAGVRKVGVVHSRKGQLAFALEKLAERFGREDAPVIMLQYSDNKEWVSEIVLEEVKSLLSKAEILLTPLSLTSGVHMGPGTWSMAFCSTKNENGTLPDYR